LDEEAVDGENESTDRLNPVKYTQRTNERVEK